MRIKRFLAPDMRTALRMIRDEQGPDAVILSNRTIDGGIEVVAATDYDEALVAQALRAAAPGVDATFATPTMDADPAGTRTATANDDVAIAASVPMPALAILSAVAAPAPAVPAMHAANAGRIDAVPETGAAPARESLIARARAVFKIGDGPTLAELAAATSPTSRHKLPTDCALMPATVDAVASPPASTTTVAAAAAAAATPFEAMMAAFAPSAARDDTNPAPVASVRAVAEANDSTATGSLHDTHDTRATAAGEDDVATTSPAPTRALHVVASAAESPSDPGIAAMRDELARMRQLMEAQMEQLSLERLRGSPARAAVFDALLGYGCEDALAQAVAARIDPRLSPDDIREPMLVELARMLTIARSEPIDEGGVIALVGPTGAGKTTTAAKLAARFAARHRARDVALVTIDNERAGAREQLHAHGRRLGITVCEAAGPEGLQDALAQLVDYPLVLVDTTGHAPRDRALFGQILWLRASRKVRSLLVLPANAHPHDLGEVIRRYRPAAPEAVVLTKLDETGRLGSALSVAVRHGLSLAYTTQGQQVPSDLDGADAGRLVHALETSRRAANNPLATEDRHAVV